MKKLVLILAFFLSSAATYARSDSEIQLQGSKYLCQIKDGSSKSSIGVVQNGVYKALSKAKLTGAMKSIRSSLTKASLNAKDKNQKRLDARGTDGYGAAEQKYIEAYRKKRQISELRKEFLACIKGKKSLIDDVSDPLIPPQKLLWDPSVGYQAGKEGESATDAFLYDSVNYEVSDKTLHGVKVIVAIHKSTISSSSVPFSSKTFASVVIDEIHEAIHTHGGFGVDSFLFKVRAPGEASSFALCKGGVSLDSSFYDTLLQTHEPFHSWNGKSYWPVWVSGGDLFQLHTFVVEELTVFFSYLIESEVVAPYVLSDYLEYVWTIYNEYKGNTEYDLPYSELAKKASEQGTSGSIHRTMMNARGVLVFYSIYKELKSKGLSLDMLTKELFLNFDASEHNYSLSDVKSILASKSGQNFDKYIDDYIVKAGDLSELLGENPTF